MRNLIWKCFFGVIISTKIAMKIFIRFPAPNYFVASWGLPGSYLGLPGDLVSNVINTEAYRKPQKSFQEALKKL